MIARFLTITGFFTLLLFSCKTPYQISGVTRKQYPIQGAIQADSGIMRLYQPYKEKLDQRMDSVIGKTTTGLSKESALPESRLGNFFADACLSEALKLGHLVDFAMPTTKGGIRGVLPKGTIRLRNVYELMPFENQLLILELSGKQVQQLLDFIARTNGQPVSGLTMEIDKGSAQHVQIGRNSFSPERNYYVLTSDYIAGGGDGAMGFGKPISQTDIHLKVRDALIKYIESHTRMDQDIISNLDGRIISHE